MSRFPTPIRFSWGVGGSGGVNFLVPHTHAAESVAPPSSRKTSQTRRIPSFPTQTSGVLAAPPETPLPMRASSHLPQSLPIHQKPALVQLRSEIRQLQRPLVQLHGRREPPYIPVPVTRVPGGGGRLLGQPELTGEARRCPRLYCAIDLAEHSSTRASSVLLETRLPLESGRLS